MNVLRLKSIAVLLIVLMTLAGCGQVEINTVVNSDGSGTRRLTVAVDEAAYNLATLTGGDPFEEIRQQAQAAGALVSPWEQPGLKGIVLSVDFDDLNALNSRLDMAGFEQVAVQRSGSLLQPTYHFQAHLDINQLPGGSLSDIGFGPTAAIVYILTMPGEIIEHNANEVRGPDIVAWRFSAVGDGIYDLQATSQVDYSRYLPLAIAGAVVLAALALVAGMGLRLMRRL